MKGKRIVSLLLATAVVLTGVFANPMVSEAASSKLYGTAKKSRGVVTLTNDYWQSGSVAYSKRLNTRAGASVSFKYCSKKGSGSSYTADGILAMFTKEKVTREFNNGNYLGMKEDDTTYAVEFDSYTNSGDLDNHHISVVQKNTYTHLKTVSNKKVSDGRWHTVKITLTNRNITVYLDKKKVLTQKVSMPGKVYFTLAGTTGASYSVQKVKDIRLVQNAEPLATPVVTVTSNKSKTATVSWKKVANADRYVVYRATSPYGTLKKIAVTSKTTYTNKRLKAGKKYYYVVLAYDKDGKYLDSNLSRMKSVVVKK